MRGEVDGDDVDDLTEPGQQQGQLLLGGLVEHRHPTPGHGAQIGLGIDVRIGLGGRLAQDLADAGVGVLQVGAGVPGGLHHPFGVEDVVLLQSVGQVGVLDGGQGDVRGCVLLGLVEQAGQRDRTPLAGLERVPVGAQHHSVPHVLGHHGFGKELGLAGHLEEHLEVVRLAHIGDVDDPVGLEFADSAADGGQVGGVVTVPTVSFAYDHGGILPLDEHTQRTAVLHGQPVGLELVDDARQVIVVGGLTGEVVVGEQHPEPGVGLVESGQGDVDERVPDLQGAFVTALQLDTKLDGIPSKVLAQALEQARDARSTILETMAEVIDSPDEMSGLAPKITSVKIPVNKIGELIGPKGKTINQITEETGADVSIEDDGTVYVSAATGEAADAAIDKVNSIANPQLPKVGERFLGTVVKTVPFGAFVSLTPGRDGLIHISNLGGDERIEKVEDVINVGDKVQVEIADIDNRGKISLVPVED